MTSNYYCEYCGVWMADNPRVKGIHENGIKHKENVAKSACYFVGSLYFYLNGCKDQTLYTW